MTFKEYVKTLTKELGSEIEIEGDACAFSIASKDGDTIEILLQGFDARGAILICADLGDPPPEGRERLFQILLEGNDLFGDTGGSTLSLDRRTGHIRLQRCNDMDVLARMGVSKVLIAFADTAAAWKQLMTDFREAPTKIAVDPSTSFGVMRV